MAICNNCGSEMDDNAKFCTSCGAPNPKMAQPDPYAQAQQNTYAQAQPDPYTQAQPDPYAQAQYSAPSQPSGPVPSPGFVESVKTCFQKYATFSGRARRSEYWYFVLFNFVASIVVSIIGNIIFGVPENGGANILSSIYSLAVLVPGLAVSWRRMHDIGKGGAWNFIACVPIIGWILLIVWDCKDSMPGPNQFGESPKYPYGA